MYSGQIFVLLGHNGSGKTSIIQMLTGQSSIDYGLANIFGIDVKSQFNKIRKQIGFCPQYDIVYEELTVQENLQLFASIKGIDHIKNHINSTLNNIFLNEKRSDLAKNLSGGQKRRLSTGIAFLGDSKFIILDEPSSGIDSYSRRQIWDIIRENKNDKIILLTTHFMDEAEYLGDRIGILKEGQLQCVGSLVHIKSFYNDCIYLTVVKKDETQLEKIIEIIQQYEGIINSDLQKEIVFQLPLDKDRFQNLLKVLEDNQETLNFESYGIRYQNLEEIYFKVLKKNQEKKYEQNDQNSYEISQIDKKVLKYESQFLITLSHVYALLSKRIYYVLSDIQSLFFEILLPIMLIYFGFSVTTLMNFEKQKSLLLKPSLYPQQDIIYSCDNTKVDKDILRDLMTNVEVETLKYKDTTLDQFDDFVLSQKSYNHLSVFYFKQINKDLIRYQSKSDYKTWIDYKFFDKRKVYNYEKKPKSDNITIYDYVNLYESKAVDAGAVFQNQMNQAIIRKETQKRNFSLNIHQYPLPITHQQTTSSGTIQKQLVSTIISLSMSFIPCSIILFLVKENQQQIKHQQHLQGINVFKYWICNYFIDYTKYLIFVVAIYYICQVIILLFQIFQIPLMYCQSNFQIFYKIILLYGIGMIGFTYFISLFFLNSAQSQVMIFTLNIFFGLLTSNFMFILRDSNQINFDNIYDPYLKLIPPYLFGISIIDGGSDKCSDYFNFQEDTNNSSKFSKQDQDFLNEQNLYYSVINAFLYFFLLILFEKSKKIINSIINCIKLITSSLQDDQKLLNKDQFSIYVSKLKKTFNKKNAVNNITFGVKQGEIFGLLGINGAGKTTTFKMITNDINPSSGQIYIKNHNLQSEQFQATKNIGYCPQQEGLFEYLTVRQHLQFFCGVQCILNSQRNNIIQNLLQELGLLKYQNYEVIKLSGGNKRKLSVAIAMLGNPQVIILDEPSTGMDPSSRRIIWRFISRNSIEQKKSCVLFTTHSLEDVEALCTKIAIMVNGQFECIGSVQQLKSQFGTGYEIDIQLNNSQQQDILSIVNEKFPLNIILRFDQFQEILQINELNIQDIISFQGIKWFQKLTYENIISDQAYQLIIQIKQGNILKNFMRQNFEDSTLFENSSTIYRYKVDKNKSISEIFNFFEINKKALNIKHYNIKQTSLEQIFNNIALKHIDIELENKQLSDQEN